MLQAQADAGSLLHTSNQEPKQREPRTIARSREREPAKKEEIRIRTRERRDK
jgi:hypothetical protein